MISAAPSCAKCGAEVLAGSRFCPQCGVSLESIGPGTMLNQWKVVGPLAEGGMGTLFRGEHTRLKRAVCIKCIQPSLAGDDSIIRRFEQEATVLASIHHPNVVTVIDLGQLPNGGLFLVLELVDGRNLREVIKSGGKMQVARALELTRQILMGLEEVHQQGVVHRDLKPSNVLLRTLRDGTDVAQLADFGIARQVREKDLTDSGLTKTGVVLGTPGYMAPEQIIGEPVDARADLYATGVMLYEMLTGSRLFDAESGVEVLQRHLTAIPPAPLGKDFAQLNGVVARALSKRTIDRFQTAREFREALFAPAAPMRALEVKTIPDTPSPIAPAAVAVAKSPALSRQTPFSELVEVWRRASGSTRAETAAMIERRIAEWCGQGAPEPILEVLQVLRARPDAELDSMIRASLLERIGALARAFAGKPELAMVLRFIGNEGHAKLVQSLRNVESAELGSIIARAVISGPAAPIIEALPAARPAGVGAIVAAAGELGFVQARPFLLLALNHADAASRLSALKMLRPDHAMQLTVEVRKRLGDRDAAVRAAAASVLGHVEDRGSVGLIVTVLRRTDSSEAERLATTRALGEIGGPEAAEALRQEFLKEKSLDVKCAMAEALGTIGDAASIELLRREGTRLLAPAQLKEICARFTRR
ncbi:MAG: protein kinase [Archangium sp.]